MPVVLRTLVQRKRITLLINIAQFVLQASGIQVIVNTILSPGGFVYMPCLFLRGLIDEEPSNAFPMVEAVVKLLSQTESPIGLILHSFISCSKGTCLSLDQMPNGYLQNTLSLAISAPFVVFEEPLTGQGIKKADPVGVYRLSHTSK